MIKCKTISMKILDISMDAVLHQQPRTTLTISIIMAMGEAPPVHSIVWQRNLHTIVIKALNTPL